MYGYCCDPVSWDLSAPTFASVNEDDISKEASMGMQKELARLHTMRARVI